MKGAFSASIIDPDVAIRNYVVTSIGNSGKIGTATFAVKTPKPTKLHLKRYTVISTIAVVASYLFKKNKTRILSFPKL